MLQYPSIGVGGYIVLGGCATDLQLPRLESDRNVRNQEQQQWRKPTRKKAGSQARSWERQAEAASRATARTVNRQLVDRGIDVLELYKYCPCTKVLASSEATVHISVEVGLFKGLHLSGRLIVEIPTYNRCQLSSKFPLAGVPDLRTWALLDMDESASFIIRNHHMNPDDALCVCMPHEWLLGVHSIKDYLAFCVMWLSKAIYYAIEGSYPGRQHYSALVRRHRDRIDEYCGCGSDRRYIDCCRELDMSRSLFDLWSEFNTGKEGYFRELERQGRGLHRPPHGLEGFSI